MASSNIRGGDAAACLEGMNAALAASRQGGSTPRHQGRILARAPAGDGEEVTAVAAPAAEAAVMDLTVLQRWQAIIKVVLGRGTGAPKQIGVIMVSTCILKKYLVLLENLDNSRPAKYPLSCADFGTNGFYCEINASLVL